MSTSDDLAEMGIIALVLYCTIGAVLTYPCLVIAWIFWTFVSPDSGFYVWLISIAILWLLVKLEAWWLVATIYIVTSIPFICLCVKWYGEMYG